MMEELSKSILMGNKSAFQITMESSLKFIPLLFEHYGYLFRNDTKVKKVIFSKERHYDAVVTRSVIGMFIGLIVHIYTGQFWSMETHIFTFLMSCFFSPNECQCPDICMLTLHRPGDSLGKDPIR